jgi:hypothetical protein
MQQRETIVAYVAAGFEAILSGFSNQRGDRAIAQVAAQ